MRHPQNIVTQKFPNIRYTWYTVYSLPLLPSCFIAFLYFQINHIDTYHNLDTYHNSATIL